MSVVRRAACSTGKGGKRKGDYTDIIFTRSQERRRENPVDEELRKSALEYHRLPRPGKVAILATKQLTNQRDLALAYSPGVAAACEEIRRDPAEAVHLTSRANLIAVITNGTAVLGLGAIGPLAAKPVMEGKAVLFKKFAGIDCFDIEIDERDPDKLVDIIAALEPTFGGINLEDIKAPECFIVERKLRARMKIPVFHDDQHGTAIIVGAAFLNGLKVIGKKIDEVKLVVSGAGAAALACLELLVKMGLPQANIVVTDIKGVVYKGRKEEMDPDKERFAVETAARTLDEVIGGADVFLGLSAGGVLKPAMVKKMAERPLILALANPEPEIRPELAKEARPDCIVATGRGDYPNQVNNVLCFPFIFRGALDVGATTITAEMELAAVRAIAELAQAEASDIVAMAYGGQDLKFGPEYLIPRPFDPRLIGRVAPAVARAAMDSGVATRPIADMDAYRESAHAVRLPLGPHHEAAVRRGQGEPAARGVRRGRGRARAARGAGGARRGPRQADRGRPAEGRRAPARDARPAHAGRARLRARQPGVRPALPRLLDHLPPAHRAARRVARVRQDRDAPAPHADRRDDDPQGRGRRACCAAPSARTRCTWSTSTR